MSSAASPMTVMAYELDGSRAARPTHGAALTRVRAISLPVGRCPPGALARLADGAFALQVVDGLLIHDLHIGGAIACALLGPSDVIATGRADGAPLVRSGWTVAAPTVIAAIDARVMALLAELPDLAAALLAGAVQQTERVTRQRAIAQLPRVEDRVLGLLWLLAERFGHVTPHGMMVPIALTHATIGRLIGAQRPTISLALKRLALDGSLRRREDGSWLLPADSNPALAPRRVHGPSDAALVAATDQPLAPVSVRGHMTAADRQHTRARLQLLVVEFEQRRRTYDATLARCVATYRQISATRHRSDPPAPASSAGSRRSRRHRRLPAAA